MMAFPQTSITPGGPAMKDERFYGRELTLTTSVCPKTKPTMQSPQRHREHREIHREEIFFLWRETVRAKPFLCVFSVHSVPLWLILSLLTNLN
jgi:hypothetical protein